MPGYDICAQPAAESSTARARSVDEGIAQAEAAAVTILSEHEIQTDAAVSKVVDKNRERYCGEMPGMGKGCAGSALLLLTSGERNGNIGNIVKTGFPATCKKTGFFLFSR